MLLAYNKENIIKVLSQEAYQLAKENYQNFGREILMKIALNVQQPAQQAIIEYDIVRIRFVETISHFHMEDHIDRFYDKFVYKVMYNTKCFVKCNGDFGGNDKLKIDAAVTSDMHTISELLRNSSVSSLGQRTIPIESINFPPLQGCPVPSLSSLGNMRMESANNKRKFQDDDINGNHDVNNNDGR
jgi:hypothetical protein